MSENYCPIGLDCEYAPVYWSYSGDYICQNINYCSLLASPWDLPYYFDEGENALIVTPEMLEYNEEIYHQEVANCGWVKAINIPYKFDEEGFMIVQWDEPQLGFYAAYPIEK